MNIEERIRKTIENEFKCKCYTKTIGEYIEVHSLEGRGGFSFVLRRLGYAHSSDRSKRYINVPTKDNAFLRYEITMLRKDWEEFLANNEIER